MEKAKSGIPMSPIQKIRSFKNFDLWAEKWDDRAYGGNGDLRVHSYRNKSGDLISVRYNNKRPGLIKVISRLGIVPELACKEHKNCSVGKGDDGKWYGWSHRAIHGFGVGDMVFDEKFGDDSTPFKKHGTVPIETDQQAKTAAMNFARYIS